MLSRPGDANNLSNARTPEKISDELTAEAIRGFRGCGVTLRQVARVYGCTVDQLRAILDADDGRQAGPIQQSELRFPEDTEGRGDG